MWITDQNQIPINDITVTGVGRNKVPRSIEKICIVGCTITQLNTRSRIDCYCILNCERLYKYDNLS